MAGLLPRLFVLALGLVVAAAGPALGGTAKVQKGVALVIGQSAYQHLPALANPANDARQMDQTLRTLGFETTLAEDLGGRKLSRAFANFAEDAEGADVAVIYYSGHGIEAGGENWLVPVDAETSALDQADLKLVSLTKTIADVSATVPLTLVFLDACRSNPFPPGAELTPADGKKAPVAALGLAVTRGVSTASAEPTAAAAAGVGTLIGFAAEPGSAALDGPVGGNSPYAAALVRHLSAIDGDEVGTVMRMVTEEVYLKTRGQQRPWVNETLTRLVYLGKSQQQPQGDEGRLLSERRQLLLTIAGLPGPEREQVETAARTAGVPMDALYGLLRSLGSRIPSDPGDLGKVLGAEAERVKQLLASQRALDSEDPEIVRLTGLAGQALEDGALDAYLSFWQQAKARYTAVSASLDDTEARLRARRLEGGEILAHTAAAFELTGDYPAAADNYARAFQQVAKWDADRAWEYKKSEAGAWLSQGDEKGDDAALAKAMATYLEALDLAPRGTARTHWARSQIDLGNALLVRGERDAGNDNLNRAIAAYRAALEELSRDREPRLWASAQNNLAIVTAALAERTGDPPLVSNAIDAYHAAISETPRSADPLLWATIASNLANALTQRGENLLVRDDLEEAVRLHRAALDARQRADVPSLWGASQENLGNALVALGKLQGEAKTIEDGIAAYRAALDVLRRERMPLKWAGIQYNLGNALGDLGLQEAGTTHLADAATAYRAALQEQSFERTPLAWAKTQYDLGENLWRLGQRTSDAGTLRQAVRALQESLRYYTRERNAGDWAITSYEVGVKQWRLGGLVQETGLIAAGVASLRQSLGFYTRERNAADWAATETNFASALAEYAFTISDDAQLREAIAAYRSVLEVRARDLEPLPWAEVQLKLGRALYFSAYLEKSAAAAREARAAVTAAAEVFDQQAQAQGAAVARELLATIDAQIAKLSL